MNSRPPVIRCHHLGCLVDFAAFGGSHPTLPALLARLRENPDQIVRVVVGQDDACLPCPFWNDGQCTQRPGREERNRAKDERFLTILALEDGQELSFRQAMALVYERLGRDLLAQLCPSCHFGQCATAIGRRPI